jgi:hypothetical protein
MMSRLTDKQVHDTLEPVLKKRLKNLDLKNIFAFSDVDYEGDQIIRVYTDIGKEISGKIYSNAIADVNAALRAAGETRFAHVSIGTPPKYYDLRMQRAS